MRVLLFAALVAAPGSPELRAQSAASASQMEELQVTAARQAQSAYDVSTAVSVVGSEELSRASVPTLPDLLRGQTGATVQQTTPGQGAVIVRGLKGSEVLHLVDGMRLNNAIFRNAPTQYLALVDSYNVERIEVARGPASTLYGSDAMGGVVQIITPVPEFDTERWDWRSRGQLSFASADDRRAGHFDIEGGTRRIALAFGASYMDVDDRRTPRGVLEPSGYLSRAANAKLVLRPDPDHELLFDAQYLEQPRTPRYDELVPGFGETEPASELFVFEPNRRTFLHGRYRSDAPFGFVDRLELDIALQEVDDDRRSRDFGAAEEQRERNQSRLWGLSAQATTEGQRHRWTYGAEVYLDEIASSRTLADPVTGIATPVTSRFPDGSRMNSFALFASDEIHLGPRLTLNVGGRYSRFDIDLPAADRGVGASLSPDDLTGDVGVTFELSEPVRLVANLGRGFRPPNVFDLGTLGERPGNRFNIANADLAPESVITVDAGVKLRSDRWRGELIGFRSEYRDKITSVPTGELTADGRTIVQSQNVNEVDLRGVELGARWLLGDATELYTNMTWTWGEERFGDGSETPADRIPPLNGRLGLLYRPDDAFWADAYLRFADDQDRLSERDVGDPRIDPDGTAGWGIVGVRVGWQGPRWGLVLSVENLFDRRYREHGSGIDAAGLDAGITVRARL